MTSSDNSSTQSPKVPRLIEEYDLHGTGATMESRWTDEDDRWSLRDLADDFNRAILASALDRQGTQMVDGELDNVYRILTDEDVASADKTRVRRQLEREGLNVDEILSDFVSYQAVRTYLRDVRGAEYESGGKSTVERKKRHLQKLQGRMEAVTESTLSQLRSADELTLSEFRLLVDVRVVCEGCNEQFEVIELLESGGCSCST